MMKSQVVVDNDVENSDAEHNVETEEEVLLLWSNRHVGFVNNSF